MNDEYESDIDKLCLEITSLCDEINAACNDDDDDLEISGIRQVSPDEFEPLHDWWHNYSGNLRTLDIRGLLESRRLRIDSQLGNKLRAECPWANEHSSGDDRASFLTADEDRGLYPTFHCFHHHCRGRTIKDVLELFSSETVEGFCSQKMGRAV